MDVCRDEFVRTAERMRARLERLSPLALERPEEDADERAAITVLLSAAFERFLKEVTREFVGALPSKVNDFHELPEVIRRTHFEGGAQLLQRMAKADGREVKARRRTRFDQSDEVVQRLAAAATVPYRLIWEAFAHTNSNVGSETVIALLRRLGVQEPWVTLMRHIPPEAYAVPEPARAGKLTAELDEFRMARNRCAHGASASAVPQWSVIGEFVTALEAAAIGYTAALKARLATF